MPHDVTQLSYFAKPTRLIFLSIGPYPPSPWRETTWWLNFWLVVSMRCYRIASVPPWPRCNDYMQNLHLSSGVNILWCCNVLVSPSRIESWELKKMQSCARETFKTLSGISIFWHATWFTLIGCPVISSSSLTTCASEYPLLEPMFRIEGPYSRVPAKVRALETSSM